MFIDYIVRYVNTQIIMYLNIVFTGELLYQSQPKISCVKRKLNSGEKPGEEFSCCTETISSVYNIITQNTQCTENYAPLVNSYRFALH